MCLLAISNSKTDYFQMWCVSAAVLCPADGFHLLDEEKCLNTTERRRKGDKQQRIQIGTHLGRVVITLLHTALRTEREKRREIDDNL